MNKKQQFLGFLESLKGHGQDALIECVSNGFQVCITSKKGIMEGTINRENFRKNIIETLEMVKTDIDNLNGIVKRYELIGSNVKERDMDKNKEKFSIIWKDMNKRISSARNLLNMFL